MNSRQSHAHRVLTTAYRSIYFKMRWMNELAERGLRPVWRTASRARQAARLSRSTSTAAPGGRQASRGRPRPAAASGLRRMEPLEMRLMLAAHDGTGLGPDAAYTFAAPLGVNRVVIQAAPWDSTLGLITAVRSGGASAAEFTETFKNFSRVIIDTTTNDVAGLLGTVIEIRGEAPLGTAGLSSLAILAGGGGDRFDVAAAAVSGITVSIDGGAGSDGIVGLMAADSTAPSNWSITGAGAGSWGAPAATFVSFTGIEDLTGAAGHDDVFEFQPGGSLAGMITGQVSDVDGIALSVTAEAIPHTISFDDDAASVDGQTVYRYTDVVDAENIVITTTSGDDHAVLAPASGFATLVLSSANGSFQPVTFKQPLGLAAIDLAGGNDRLAFAAGGLPAPLVVAVDGGDGIDTILGPAVAPGSTAANDWLFDGTDAGWFNEQIRFDGIENVTGTAGTSDVFTFGVGGRLTGTLTGQTADTDSIVVELAVDAAPTATPQSLSFATGVITLDGTAIVAHAGIAAPATVRISGTLNDDSMLLAPGTLAGTLVLTSGDGGFAPITFDRPASLVLAPGRGDDRVTVNAASLPTAISISDEDGTDSLAVVVPGVLAPLSLTLAAATAGAGSIGVGDRSISYSGIEDSQNLIFEGTAAADSLRLAAAGSRLQLDVNGQLITFDRPSGTLAIRGLGGSDTIEVAAGLSLLAPLTLDGGDDTDTVSLAGALGAVTLTADNETVVSTATIDTLSFQATTGDDSIRLTSPAPGTIQIESLNTTFSPLTIRTPLVGLEIDAGGGDDSVAVELASFAPALFIDGQLGDDTLAIPSGSFQTLGYAVEHIDSNASVRDLTHTTTDGEVTVQRDDVTGRIKIHDANGDSLVLDPSDSLTIDVDPSRPGGITRFPNRVVLGNFPATEDVIIGRRGQYERIDVTGNVLLNGHRLELTARHITVKSGVIVSTRHTENGKTAGNSGAILLTAVSSAFNAVAAAVGVNTSSFTGTSILLEPGAQLLADVDDPTMGTPGPITLRALTDRFVPTPYVRWVNGSGTVTLDRATVRGGAVEIDVTVNSATIYGEKNLPGIVSGAVDYLLSVSDVAGVASSTATGTITVGSESTIVGSSVSLSSRARTRAYVQAVNAALAVAYGQSKPTAEVSIASDARIDAAGDVAITTTAQSEVDVYATQGLLGPNASNEAGSVTVAIGYANAVSKAVIAPGAEISAGGNVDIASNLEKRQGVAANAGSYQEGSVGIGLAVSVFQSDVQATVGGTISAGGRVNVAAEITTPNNRTFADAVVGDAWLSRKIRSLKSGDGGKIAKTANAIFSQQGLLGKILQPGGKPRFDNYSGQTKPGALAGAIAVADHEDNVTARIEPGASVITTNGNVRIAATVNEFPQMRAASAINSDAIDAAKPETKSNNRDHSVSVATSVGCFRNNATATIGEGAKVDASGSVDVSAETLTPLGERWWGGGPMVQGSGFFTDKLNGDVGIQKGFFASWATSTAQGNKTAVAGAIDYYAITNKAHATVDSNAVIAAGGNVAIRAKAEGNVLHASGNFGSPFLIIRPTTNGGNAVGAAYAHGVYENDVVADVLNGATITGDAVSVTADNEFSTISVGVAAGSTKGIGFNGSGTTAEVTNTTRARIADNATVITRAGTIEGVPGVSLLVSAEDKSSVYNVAGGVLLGENTGFGVSVAVNLVSRDTQAIVGNAYGTPRTGRGATLSSDGGVSVIAVNSGNQVALSLAAAVVSQDGMGGQAWDIQNNIFGKEKAIANFPVSTTGFGLAGAVSVTRRTDVAQATINTAGTIKASALEVRAENNAVVVTVTGAMAYAKSANNEADRPNKGIAGSLSYNELSGTTRAQVAGSTKIEVGTLDVVAKRLGIIVAVAGGGSGASGTKGTAVAGSVAVNKITDTVDAQMTNVNVQSDGNVNVTSSNGSQIWSLAGALAFGGTGGYGIAIGVNLIGTPNDPSTTTASVSDSTIEIARGMLTIAATVDTPGIDSNPRIAAVTGSVGWGGQNKGEEESVGGAGMIAFSRIRSVTRASLTSTKLTEKPNDPGTVSLKVYAKDDSAIIAVSGAVGAGQSAGIGAAIGYNEIRATTQASVNASDVTIGGSVEVKADSTAKIGGCVVGVGVGTGDSSWALAGSAATNVIVLGIDAHIANGSIIRTDGAIDVRASDDSEIVSVGGAAAVSLSGSRGVGAAIGYNRVSNAIAAFIDDSTVSSAAGRISVVASSTPLLVGIAAAGAGGAGGKDGKSLSGAGTIVINSIANTVDAHIRRSTVTAAADVLVTATEAATLRSVALAVAGSKSGSGIGAVLAYNYVGGSSDPADPNVIKVNDGVVDGTFEATTADDGTRSDVQAVIEDATVVAGGRVVVSSGFESPATLQDSGPSVSKTLPLDPASAVTLTGDAIRFPSEHGLRNGDRVVYRPGNGAIIGGLQDGQSYFVVVVDPRTVKLAASLDNAVAGRAVPLSSLGSGSPHVLSRLDFSRQAAFAASAQTVQANAISLPNAHTFTTGAEVVYLAEAGQADIGGLTSGRSYFVIIGDAADDKSLRLASTRANAIAGEAIPLTAVDATGQMLVPVDATPLTFNAATAVAVTQPRGDQIAFAEPHGLVTGNAVIYRNGSGTNTSIGGLQAAETYYVIVIDPTHIQLARSLHDTEDGSRRPIFLTSVGSGSNHELAVMKSIVTIGEVSLELPAAALSSQMTSVTVGGGGGDQISGAGAISLNFVRSNVAARISRTADGTGSVSAAGGVAVRANDSSRVESGAGTLAISKSGSAIGASIGLNDVKNNVSATIDRIGVTSSAGGITVKATERARVRNVVVGFAGSGDGNLAFGGSFAINTIRNTVTAGVTGDAKNLTRLDAHRDITIRALDTASIATLAGNAGVNLGGTAGVGVAFAYNDILDEVTATVTGTRLRSAIGGITVDAKFAKPTGLPPDQNSQIAAMAVSGGVAEDFAGAGSVALNWVRPTVVATIADITAVDPTPGADEISAAGAISITASDSSTIESLAGAFAVAGWGAKGGSGAVGASISYNVLGGNPRDPASQDRNSVRASLANIRGTVRAGSIDVHATRASEVGNVTLAGAGAGSFALGGSVTVNTVRIETLATIANVSSVTTTQTGAESLRVRADDLADGAAKSKIWAFAGGIGIVIPKAKGSGLGLGIAAAENLITTVTRATVVDTVVDTRLVSAGGIVVTATASPDIRAWTIGVAAADGPSTGGKFAGAGAGSGNEIESTTEAFIQGVKDRIGITANSGGITVSANDTSNILAVAGTLAIAGLFGGGSTSGSLGVSVTRNEITPTVNAFIQNASIQSSGGVAIKATDEATLNAYAIGGTIARSKNAGEASLALAIAVSSATNTVIANVGASMDKVATGATAPSSISLTASQDSTINAYCISASISIADGDTSMALTGGGAEAINTIGGDTKATVDSSKLGTSGGLTLTAENTAKIHATVAAVSLAASRGNGAAFSVAIGASLTTNDISGTTAATLTRSSVNAEGPISVTAGAEQSVEAFVLAGAIALAKGSGIAGGGSGASAINNVEMTVMASIDNAAASIDNAAAGGITGSTVVLAAIDTSTIDAEVGAVTIAAAKSDGGLTLSIAASIARNTVKNSVTAAITNSNEGVVSTAGDITLTARENAAIRVSSSSVALSVSLAKGFSVGVAGAGAEATNVVLTKTNARVAGSSLRSAGNVTLDSRTSPATTLFTLPAELTAADLDDKARLDEQAELPAGITPEEQASRAKLADQLRAAFRGNQRLGSGDLQLVTLEAGRNWQLTDSRHNVFLITLTDGQLSVAKPLISAAVVSAAIGVGVGSGGGASIGASVTCNLIGYTASGDKRPAEVKATVSNTSIRASGKLTQTAINAATIDAVAFAGSVAGSKSSSDLAVSLGGAGARVLNKVATDVAATIDGNGTAAGSIGIGIEASDVVLAATDTSVASAWTGALAIAAAFGGSGVGVSVSIGVGQAENNVANTIEASIRNANAGVTATTGDISLRADSRATLSATAWAASLAVGFGSTVGVALAGAGIEAVNTLGNTVQAGIANSTVDVAGGLSIVASETSSLKSLGVAAAAAISGGGFAVSIAAVGGVANNDVTNKVSTFVTDSKVNTQPGTASIGSGGVTISASANETLAVQVIGAVAAVTLAPAGAAVAVGVARARNEIRDEVTSIVSGGTLRARGPLSIAATTTNDVNAVARAAAVAVSGDVSVAAGGADAFNTVASTVAAGATGAVITAGGDLAIRAEHTAVFDARVTAVAVAFGRIGGSIGVSRIDNTDTSSITAAVSGGSVSSSGGGVTIEARADDTTERSRGVATAVTIAFGGAGAGTDVRTTFTPTLVAQVGILTTVTAPNGTVRVGSTLTSDARAETYGVAGGMVAIGAARGFATAHGSVSTIVDGTVSGRSITLGSLATTTAWVEATGLAGGTAGAAAGAGATARSNPTVTTRANASSRLHATDVVSITAQAVPFARSRADGVAISGGGSLGVASSRATASPIVTAEALSFSPIFGRPTITAAELVVNGRVVPGTSGITARATATAGAGGVLIGAMGATSRATSAGAVTARIGDDVRLPAGNVTVAATADTRQTANALGVAVGFIGVGGVDATADAGVVTRAAVGTGITSDPLRTGDLVIIANGGNRNAAASTAGSGGVIAGNSSRGIIRDTSTATAAIGGGEIHAGSIVVDARQATQYAPVVDSYNASLVGGGGAYVDNSAETAAATTIGGGTQLLATSLIRLASENRYQQSQAEFSTRGGAGGAVSGADALTRSTLTGTSSVTLGDDTTIRSGSLVLVASHDLNTADRVRMDSGGLINGSTVRSKLTATLANTVNVGSRSSLRSSGDISVGTYTTARASTTANVVTFGVAGAGIARSIINVGSTQGITIGNSSTIFSQGNVRLTAGRDTFGNNATSLSGRSIADSLATGLLNIPAAYAESKIDDATSLDVRDSSRITAAGNVELAAGHAAPVCSARGVAYWNGATFPTKLSVSTATPSATGRVTNNGTVEAGIYRTLRITIPDARNAAVVAGSDQPIIVDSQSPTLPSIPGGVFSRTVTVNPGNEPFLPFTVTPLSQFDPVGFVNANYDADQAAIIRNGVSSAPVYALRLDGLQARGGTVTLAADTFTGGGTVTAYGGPKVIIKNHSPNYLLVGNINLPDLPGGQILFTGSSKSAGFTLNQVDADVDPLVKVSNLFNADSGNSSLGPALFIVDPISNLGGAVDITNVRGSVGQLSAIVAASVAVAAPNGSYLVNIPAPGSFSLASPEAQWNRSMSWPGGNPAVPGFNAASSAMWAAAYVANAVYNPNGSLAEAALNSVLFHQTPVSSGGISYQSTVVMYGGSVPRAAPNGNDVGAWTVPRGDQNPWSPVGSTTLVPYLVSRTSAQRRTDPTYYFPTVPVTALSLTQQPLNPAPTQPVNPTPQSATDAVRAGQVSIQAQFINVNGTIQAGRAVEEVVVTTIEADLDNLASLHDTLRGNGITLPAEIVNERGEAANADVRPIIARIAGLPMGANARSALLRQMLALQYLGYFNGTATAHVPLNAISAAHRESATAYAAAVAAERAPPISAQLSPSQWSRQAGFPADSTTLFNDARARVTFDLPTKTISCGNVAAAVGAGFVSLRGGIVNTGTTGRITATSGAGQVRISNPTRYPLVMHDVHTSTTASNSLPAGIVDIVDTLKPAASGHTVYVSAVGAGVKTYVGSVDTSFKALIAGNPTASTSGQEATYAPAANLRWQWTNFATITRTVTYGQASAWQWNTPGVAEASTNPWIFVTDSPTGLDGSRLSSNRQAGGFLTRDPIGVAVTQPGAGNIAFQQTITGGITNRQTLNVTSSWFGNRSYEYPTAGWLRMTSSAKADYPFAVSFRATAGLVDISSRSAVTFLGEIVNPRGTTRIQTDGGLTTTAASAIESGDLTLSAVNSAIGTAAAPLHVALGPNARLTATAGAGGVAITSDSSLLVNRIVARAGSGAYGDILLESEGGITAVPGVVNLEGRSIAVSSTTGGIGSASALLGIQTHSGSGITGTLRASAEQGVRLWQPSGDLSVKSIVSRSGNVVLNVPAGRVLNAGDPVSSEPLSGDDIDAVCKDLQLLETTGAKARLQHTIDVYETQVERAYHEYWQLRDRGTVVNGVFTLAADAIELYREQATAALDLPTPASDAEVLHYTRGRYEAVRNVFDSAFDGDYWPRAAEGDAAAADALKVPERAWMARPEFIRFDKSYAYAATADQVAALTRQGVWKKSDLENALPTSALLDPAVVVPPLEKPNISGRDVTINDAAVPIMPSSGVGSKAAPVTIPIADLLAGTLTPAQKTAIGTAHEAGEVALYGIKDGVVIPIAFDGRNPIIPAGVRLSHVVVQQKTPLITNASGILSIRTAGPILVESTASTVTVGQIEATVGGVEITASGPIVAAQQLAAVVSGGSITMVAGSGGIGSAGTPLGVAAGGSLSAVAGGGGIVLQQLAGDMRVKRVAAKADVGLRTGIGSIVAAAGGTAPVVSGANVVLDAAGGIGVPGRDLVVAVSPGSRLTATARQGLQIEQAGGDLTVARATTTSGGVRLTVPSGSLTLPAGGVLGSSSGPALLQVRDAVTLAAGSNPFATTWFGVVGRYGRAGAPSTINASNPGGSSVITAPYRSISQWAASGSGAAPTAGDGPAEAARNTLETYTGGVGAVAVDGEGSFYFVNNFVGRLRQIDWTGTVRTVYASGLQNVQNVTGLAADGAGNLVIADAGGAGQASGIKMWNAATSAVTTIVPTANPPAAVAVDAIGNIVFIVGDRVKLWTAQTGAIRVLPFTGLNVPGGVATDAAGNVYVVDTGNSLVRKWVASTDQVVTLTAFTGLRVPRGIAVNAAGDILVADTGNDRVQILDAVSGAVSTLIAAGLSNPVHLAVDGQGNVATINAVGTSRSLDVYQPWAGVTSTSVAMPATGGSGVLPAVAAGSQSLVGRFVPTSDRSWLRVTEANDGVVRFAVDTAPSGSVRQGHITILGRRITVSQAAGQTTTAINGRTVAYGANGMVWVTVRSTHATPTGPVSLRVDGGPALTATLVASANTIVDNRISFGATATFNVGLLRGGAHKLEATYADQATFTGSSATGDIEVTRAVVRPTLGQSADTTAFGRSASFTARIAAVAGGAMPTGRVQFYRGSTLIPSLVWFDANGRASLTVSTLPVGTHNITARYSGDGNYAPATSEVIVHTVT
jgi:hypothetical protein